MMFILWILHQGRFQRWFIRQEYGLGSRASHEKPGESDKSTHVWSFNQLLRGWRFQGRSCAAPAAAAVMVLWVQPVTMGLIVVFGGTWRAAAEPPRGQHAVIVCPPVITDYGVVMRGGGVFSGADKTNIKSFDCRQLLGCWVYLQDSGFFLNNQVKHSNFMTLSGQNKSGSRQ